MDETLYPFDQEHIEEMARLNKQASVLNAHIPLPNVVRRHSNEIYRVLDLGCGPGSWSRSVAQQFPKWQVSGLDISKRMIGYAQVQARTNKTDNVSFQVGNATKPLPFQDSSVDFVHARMIQGFVRLDGWTRLFAECLRVLKPGGYFQITEAERPACNKTANTKLYSIIGQAGLHAGVNGSPDGQLFGVCHLLSRYLKDVGFSAEAETPYSINFSAHTPIHQVWCEDVLSAFKQMPGLLTRFGMPAEEIEQLCQQAAQEMAEPDFCAIMFFLSVVARKPI